MTTETQPVDMTALWKAFEDAVGKHDLKAATAAQSEIKKAENAEREVKIQAEGAKRKVALEAVQKALTGITLKPIRDAMQINGRITRGENGAFDNLTIQVGVGELNLSEMFYATFPEAELKDLETVQGINFTIKANETMVEYTGKRAKTGTAGGNGGKGYTKEGSPLTKLGDIFNAYATDADKAKAAEYAAKGDGSGEYRTKVAVAKREGFQQNS